MVIIPVEHLLDLGDLELEDDASSIGHYVLSINKFGKWKIEKKNSPNNTMMSFERIFGGTSVIPMSGIMRFKSWIKDIHLCNK